MPENKTHRGNCHCGAFIFTLCCPEITRAFSCNCSICTKKGAIWTFLKKDMEFNLVKGDETNLVEYQFGNKSMQHKFCPTCGTPVYSQVPSSPAGENMAFNTRAIQDLSMWTLEVDHFDGAALPPSYTTPGFTGPGPNCSGVSEGPAKEACDTTYTGSCHCGAVTLALRTQKLDEKMALIVDCNCSVCVRTGAIWTYPHNTQVSLRGESNLTSYSFGPGGPGTVGVWDLKFCKNCGVFIMRSARDLSESDLALLTEKRRTFFLAKKEVTPINLNVLDKEAFTVEGSGVKVMKLDGWKNIEPLYVNP